MDESLLPQTHNEVRIIHGIRIMVMEDLQPATPEELEAAEQECLRRIKLRLEHHRSEEWEEVFDESRLEPEPWVESLSALDATMEQMARAEAFLAVEQGKGTSQTLFYEIRSEDMEELDRFEDD